jgi:hypothetical protein
MACTYKYGEKEGGERGKERDAIRMLAQHSLGNLYQPIHTA